MRHLLFVVLFLFSSFIFSQSSGYCPVVVADVINTASKLEEGVVQASNNKQRSMLEKYIFPANHQIDLLSQYLESYATNIDDDMNSWLETKGFDITVSYPKTGLGVASSLDILVDWIKPGDKTFLKAKNSKKYEAVHMRAYNKNFIVYEVPEYSYPLTVLKTKQGIDVQILEVDKAYKETDILDMIHDVLEYDWQRDRNVEEIKFPMLEFSQKIDIAWLSGLNIGGFKVDEAQKQLKFHMDEKGAHAQAVAVLAVRGLSKTVYVDRPFILWMTAEGSADPIFAVYADYDSWIK